MNYKVKISSVKNDHFIKDNVLFAKPKGATPMSGKDNKMFIVYDLGLKITVPNGIIGLILPPNNSSMYSVAQTGNFILMPGNHDNVSIEYKINTDAIPRVFEQNEVCAQILFLSVGDISFESIVEEKQEIAEPSYNNNNENIESSDSSINTSSEEVVEFPTVRDETPVTEDYKQ